MCFSVQRGQGSIGTGAETALTQTGLKLATVSGVPGTITKFSIAETNFSYAGAHQHFSREPFRVCWQKRRRGRVPEEFGAVYSLLQGNRLSAPSYYEVPVPGTDISVRYCACCKKLAAVTNLLKGK
jgi:hypothetical protein